MTLIIDQHRNKLLQILKDIYSDSELASCLGFKGGTAAYLFYDLNRFSVDLDFDLLDESKEDLVFAKIEIIANKYGVIKDKAKKRFNVFFLLSYQEGLQGIKIEISRRYFESKYELKSYMGISMLVMAREDMFANKLLALHDRMEKASRDIFDVWFFRKNDWPVNRELVEQRSKMRFEDLVSNCITRLEKITKRNILAGLGELLTESQKDWAKAKLIDDTVFLLRLMIGKK